MMKVLVTGGAGFIGRHTALALLERGYEVRVLDNLDSKIHRNGEMFAPLPGDVRFCLGDVRSKRDWKSALTNCDVVFHFASYQDYMNDFSKFYDVNVVGTALMYEVIVKEKLSVSKIIVATSQSIYGEGKYFCKKDGVMFPDMRKLSQLKKGIFDVSCPQCSDKIELQWTDECCANPQNAYGMSKMAQERLSLQLGKRYGIPTTCLRYSIVQGPYQSFFNAYSGACRLFCLSYYFNLQPVVYEDGNQLRDFVNIEDVVRANLLVLDKNDETNYEIYNVGGGKAYSVNQFLATVAQEIRGNIPSLSNQNLFRFGDTRHILSDINKLKLLGWSPKNRPEKSVRDYFNWLRTLDQVDNVLLEARDLMKKNDVEQTI